MATASLTHTTTSILSTLLSGMLGFYKIASGSTLWSFGKIPTERRLSPI